MVYLDKIKDMEPFSSMENVADYFIYLDHFHQRINCNQTKGIPAGVFSAHIASELLMICVDDQIRKGMPEEGMEYIRYVDDLTLLC